MAHEIKIGSETINAMMEATGRYNRMESDDLSLLKFWDIEEERFVFQPSESTIEGVMGWIAETYKRDYTERGEWNARRKIKEALGL